MKKEILALLLFTLIGFSACQKESLPPAVKQSPAGKTASVGSTSVKQDTASDDTTKGYLRLQLAKDPINTDNILIEFNPAASPYFVADQDAPDLHGFGAVCFASLSTDNVALSINQLPLISKGTTIGLAVSAKTTGIYKLNLLTINAIPSTINIWLKDNYKKDSLDFRNNPSYAFNLTTTDTITYGSHRFSLVLRSK